MIGWGGLQQPRQASQDGPRLRVDTMLAQHLVDVGQQRWWHAQGADLFGGQVS